MHSQAINTSLQTDNHVSTSSLEFFTGWMFFLTPNQQCQSSEGMMMPKETRYFPVCDSSNQLLITLHVKPLLAIPASPLQL